MWGFLTSEFDGNAEKGLFALRNYGSETHCGDCTKENITCLRCMYEEAKKVANKAGYHLYFNLQNPRVRGGVRHGKQRD